MTKLIYESPDRGKTVRERQFHTPMKQVKSHWYYYFWGLMALAVVGGQIYVGTGYRKMAAAYDNTQIVVTCSVPNETSVHRINPVGAFE